MKKSELKKLIKEELDNTLMPQKAVDWLKRAIGFSENILDGIKYGEVEEFEPNEVPNSILNYLKNVGRIDFPINGEDGYALSYHPSTDQVWFDNVL
jgi:hypothetical protein